MWIHGEGMGEFNAATPLIAELRASCPGMRFVFTASRSATCNWLAAKYPNDICLPHTWDISASTVCERINPRLIVLLEFHDAFCPSALIWAKDQGVPIVVVNGRRLHRGKPWRFHVAERLGLVRSMAHRIDRFLVQEPETRDWLGSLGVPGERVIEVGNLKYDFTPPAGTGIEVDSAEPVLVAGCIHPDEEPLLLDTHRRLRKKHAGLRLIVAPYSATQVASLERRLAAAGLRWNRASTDGTAANSDVLLLDTFGDLAAMYAQATLVVLGGSFTPAGGGHSLVEAAAHARPIVFGPYMSSQMAMVRQFLEAGAALQVSAESLTAALEELLRDRARREAIGDKARRVVAANAGATRRTIAALAPFLAKVRRFEIGTGRSTYSIHSGAKFLAKSLALTAPGQLLLGLRSRRLEDFSAVQHRLGQPDTILCLGNGPSSEDPCLDHITYDCLFRVNWRWVERGRFDRPNVVFTGDRESLRRCPPTLFGFRTIDEELSVLAHTWFDRRRRRVEYFTAERLPLWLNRDWGARPTNGAVMVAVAAALQPRRLVIAGIDLFGHAGGRYPGEAAGNRYAPMHDRDVELAILREALARYSGDVCIISPVLQEALKRGFVMPTADTSRAA